MLLKDDLVFGLVFLWLEYALIFVGRRLSVRFPKRRDLEPVFIGASALALLVVAVVYRMVSPMLTPIVDRLRIDWPLTILLWTSILISIVLFVRRFVIGNATIEAAEKSAADLERDRIKEVNDAKEAQTIATASVEALRKAVTGLREDNELLATRVGELSHDLDKSKADNAVKDTAIKDAEGWRREAESVRNELIGARAEWDIARTADRKWDASPFSYLNFQHMKCEFSASTRSLTLNFSVYNSYNKKRTVWISGNIAIYRDIAGGNYGTPLCTVGFLVASSTVEPTRSATVRPFYYSSITSDEAKKLSDIYAIDHKLIACLIDTKLFTTTHLADDPQLVDQSLTFNPTDVRVSD